MQELQSLMTIIESTTGVLDNRLIFMINSITRKTEELEEGHKRVLLDSYGFLKIERIVGTRYMYNAIKEILGLKTEDDRVKIERTVDSNRMILDIYY